MWLLEKVMCNLFALAKFFCCRFKQQLVRFQLRSCGLSVIAESLVNKSLLGDRGTWV